jgi:hypothetical protein
MRANFVKGQLFLVPENPEDKEFVDDLFTRVILTEHPTPIPDPISARRHGGELGAVVLARLSELAKGETVLKK